MDKTFVVPFVFLYLLRDSNKCGEDSIILF